MTLFTGEGFAKGLDQQMPRRIVPRAGVIFEVFEENASDLSVLNIFGDTDVQHVVDKAIDFKRSVPFHRGQDHSKAANLNALPCPNCVADAKARLNFPADSARGKYVIS